MAPEIRLGEESWLLVLTGAGVSAESGLPTFRDANGLWEQHRVEDVASPEGFEANPNLVWRFYSERRAGAASCQPNAGHRALVEVEQHLGERFLLVTQNVDALHPRAGSRRLLEIHGNLFRTRCASCDRAPFDDDRQYLEELPRCDRCTRGLLRPDIVWFGEMLDPAHFRRIDAFFEAAARGKLFFLAAGTSGVVYPAAGMVDLAARAGAETWLVNAEPADNAARFQHFVQGKSAETLPGLFRRP
ncbi:MAG TPA: NAD-dependent deacylase [Myxococcaceae bacterium]|nr:NAD-dependent deacylase [Myxococcaceae bacterium]